MDGYRGSWPAIGPWPAIGAWPATGANIYIYNEMKQSEVHRPRERESARSRCDFIAQWLEGATRPWVRFPAGLHCVFSSFFIRIRLSVLLSLSGLKEKRI